MKKFLTFMALSLISGCTIYDTIFATTVYCNTLPESVRQTALERMQGAMDGYPEHSICDTEGFVVDILKPE